MVKPSVRSPTSVYRIKIKGHLDPKWEEWFEDMTITHSGEETILEGAVKDQSALHGLLIKIRDLNLVLLSLDHIESSGGRS